MQESTGIVPKALIDRPSLIQRWQFAKTIFDELSGSRHYTAGGPANIPYSEYSRYANDRHWPTIDLVEVWEDLSVIDSIWLSEVSKKQAAQRNST